MPGWRRAECTQDGPEMAGPACVPRPTHLHPCSPARAGDAHSLPCLPCLLCLPACLLCSACPALLPCLPSACRCSIWRPMRLCWPSPAAGSSPLCTSAGLSAGAAGMRWVLAVAGGCWRGLVAAGGAGWLVQSHSPRWHPACPQAQPHVTSYSHCFRLLWPSYSPPPLSAALPPVRGASPQPAACSVHQRAAAAVGAAMRHETRGGGQARYGPGGQPGGAGQAWRPGRQHGSSSSR